MKKRNVYEQEIAELPPGLERAILRVLSFHRGRSKAIGRMALVAEVKRHGIQTTERQARECIKRLRRAGHLICSAPGEDGGYYLAETLAEYDDFRRTEFAAKIKDMSETMREMDAAARREFGSDIQPQLF